MDLFEIKDPQFLKDMSLKELNELAETIRAFLLDTIPKTGGHLSSNLGTIELIIALHYVFDSPTDALLFDVGHQAYTHKILTGRAKDFATLRQTDGLSGYTHYDESEHDQWESGHAGTSLSALMGTLLAKRIKKEDGEAIAVIGDASITNGMAFEALNLLGSRKDMRGIIVLNDNDMSISKSVSSFSRALTRFRSMRIVFTMKRFWQGILPRFLIDFLSRVKRGIRGFLQRKNIFEDLGYMYIGPVDGHDMKSLIYNFERIKRVDQSVVIHAITDKGKGHPEAEADQIGTYHGISKTTGHRTDGISWSEAIARIMVDLQKEIETFVIMPAMEVGTKFELFAKQYGDRYIDVGIAEEMAATMAGAMAHREIPIFLSLYATFAQRAFDQILNDICRSNHHVVIGIDRAGIIGEDGSTHQGLFDVSMFYLMPNTVIVMPYHAREARSLLHYGFLKQKNPFIIRYPRGLVAFESDDIFEPIEPKWKKLAHGDSITMISYGPSLDLLLRVKREFSIDGSVVNARFIKPIDQDMMHAICQSDQPIFVYEEAANSGSLYPQILAFMAKHGYHNRITERSITDRVVPHGRYEDLLSELKMDARSIGSFLKEFLHETR
jgi:1-deoxy-D-xylulose-5-phosphate synthase